jgi:hypothetical protein
MVQIFKSSLRHIKFILIFAMLILLMVISVHFETQKSNKPNNVHSQSALSIKN